MQSFSQELSYPYLAFQYQHPITDLSFLIHLLIIHSPPNEPPALLLPAAFQAQTSTY